MLEEEDILACCVWVCVFLCVSCVAFLSLPLAPEAEVGKKKGAYMRGTRPAGLYSRSNGWEQTEADWGYSLFYIGNSAVYKGRITCRTFH